MMKTILKLLVAASMLTVSTVGYGQERPVVYVLATGGTIAGEGASSTGPGYTAGTVGVEAMIASVPEMSDVADVRGQQVVNIASQDMTQELWLHIARRVNELLADEAVSGVVVTHGTDTMEETAYFLNLVVGSSKPVVLTGAMRPSTAISPDGPRNLYNAVRVASDRAAAGRGVMVVMDDMILGADDIQKMHTLSAGTFRNPNFGPLGYIYGGKPHFTRESIKKHTYRSGFSVESIGELPIVYIVPAYAGADAGFVDVLRKGSTRGIVLSGVGNGNAPSQVIDALAQARQEGMAVVRSSRIAQGPTTQWNEVDDDALGFAASWHHTPQRARILLMMALTITDDPGEIQRIFNEY